MAETIKQTENAPESYPDAPSGLSAAAAALDAAMIWQRIEAYVAHRWTARDVIWIVEGDGEWTPPLTPAAVSTVEVWEASAWVETVPLPSPLGGYELPGEGPYRITASVGGGTVPEVVDQAFRRLAEYWAVEEKHPGASAFATSVGTLDLNETRAPTWVARAMQHSGAADLLRPYRRA
ncbi:hypothetical protein [Sinisalibacter lacisalsi]|uniref:Phage tail protein n=1 Tax=Sinisalibacter lacisalsi TaxID=1526570 RepID=A0ABQ1QN47_9RHOB|nr:hypothetical protein [Sinisalibacter lacisalsi]GGD30839.1 hypothetical protein GCM10011358_13610 [Sinisalibacter lacisalsi]